MPKKNDKQKIIEENNLEIMKFMGYHIYRDIWEFENHSNGGYIAVKCDLVITKGELALVRKNFLDEMNVISFNSRSIPNRGKVVSYFIEDFNYHESFDLLMEVCLKFDSIYNTVPGYLVPDQYAMHCDTIDHNVIYYDINILYLVVANAIRWYNNLKPS